MPRKPSRSHPLRTARGILGLTQTQFAASVGTSAVNIQQIENHVSKMSPGLARRISQVYRLDPRQLMSGANPDKPHLALKPEILFTKEGFERLSRVTPDEVAERREALVFLLDLLFDVAEDSGLYRVFLYDLCTLLKQRAMDFGFIEPALEKLAEYGAYPGHPELTSQILDMLFSASGMQIKVTDYVETRKKLLSRGENLNPEPVTPQSSRKDKSPKKTVPRVPQPYRGNASERPSGSRRARAAG